MISYEFTTMQAKRSKPPGKIVSCRFSLKTRERLSEVADRLQTCPAHIVRLAVERQLAIWEAAAAKPKQTRQ